VKVCRAVKLTLPYRVHRGMAARLAGARSLSLSLSLSHTHTHTPAALQISSHCPAHFDVQVKVCRAVNLTLPYRVHRGMAARLACQLRVVTPVVHVM